MRSSHDSDEFENFLQEQVNQHRMYPSDHVWINIRESIHGTSRWPALTFISIFLIVLLTIGTLVIKPHKQMVIASQEAFKGISQTTSATTSLTAQEALEEHLSPGKITGQTIAAVTKTLALKDSFLAVQRMSQHNIVLTAKHVETEPLVHLKNQELENPPLKFFSNALIENSIEKFSSANGAPASLPDDYALALKYTPSLLTSANADLYTYNSLWKPISVNAQETIKRRFSNLDFQFYVTPSVSYRRLIDAKTGHAALPFISGIPLSANYTLDLNQVARHRPAMGTEVGFAVGYKLTQNLVLKTGFQFNIRKYNIEAYTYSTPASTAASSLLGNPADSSNPQQYGIFQIGSVPGAAVTLNNTYYEISMPVGVDLRLIADGKFTWNVAAAIQPTYTFDKEPFIITSDYKNYTDGSSLIRNWNINTNFETYISYKKGNFRWQIGPQFRYQLLPTLSNAYPIREYLMDYGVKLGFSKTIK